MALGLLAADLFAQSPPPPPPPIEDVYSTNSNTGTILKLDFATSSSTVVNTDVAQRSRIEGIAVRDDGSAQHLLVCDRGSSEVLFYENAGGAGQTITDAIDRPHSVSLDQSGNAYVVSALNRQVWKLPVGGANPGGYGAPLLIDSIPGSSLLMEAKLVSYSAGLLQTGGLAVLSKKPAVVYFYPPDPQSPTGFGPRQVLVPSSAFPKKSQPTSFAFAPDQGLLVAAQDGKVLRFDVNGARVSPNFATGFGKGLVKIAVGVQDGASRLFVSEQRAGGRIKRLLINSDGTGTLDASVKEHVRPPGDLNTASAAGSAPTPPGDDVVVTPAPEVEITFDTVNQAGITTAEIIEFPDNRAQLNGGNSFIAQSLRDFFDPDDPLRARLPDATIPANIQAFRKGDPDTGPPTFLLAIIDTTATFDRTVEVHYDEAEQLGYEPDCADADVTKRPRTFYAPEIGAPKSEPPLVEGDVFVNFSTDCGSNIGRGGRFSLWLTAREMDPPADTADSQLANIQAAMDFYPCIDPDIKGLLEGELQAAVAAFEDFKETGDPADRAEALARLEAFIAVIDANPGAFTACSTFNVGGELIARAQAAEFSINNVPGGGGGTVSVLIVHSDDAFSVPQAELTATGKFSTVDVFDANVATPSLGTLQDYDVVLAYTNFIPFDAVGLGNVLADYVDTGGGVAIATYSFSSPWAIAGRITTAGYSPLLDVGQNGFVTGSLSALVPTDPVFDGVDLNSLTYFNNANFAHPALAGGATLVATDGEGVNMIARSGKTMVIGLNLFPGNNPAGNNAEFYELLGNAITSVNLEE
jgi:hypothetical protein